MLSEWERDNLLEMQRHLISDDPNFERSLQALDEVVPAARAKRLRASSLLIGGAVVIAVVMLLAGSAVGAFAYSAIAVLVWTVRGLPRTVDREKRRD